MKKSPHSCTLIFNQFSLLRAYSLSHPRLFFRYLSADWATTIRAQPGVTLRWPWAIYWLMPTQFKLSANAWQAKVYCEGWVQAVTLGWPCRWPFRWPSGKSSVNTQPIMLTFGWLCQGPSWWPLPDGILSVGCSLRWTQPEGRTLHALDNLTVCCVSQM